MMKFCVRSASCHARASSLTDGTQRRLSVVARRPFCRASPPPTWCVGSDIVLLASIDGTHADRIMITMMTKLGGIFTRRRITPKKNLRSRRAVILGTKNEFGNSGRASYVGRRASPSFLRPAPVYRLHVLCAASAVCCYLEDGCVTPAGDGGYHVISTWRTFFTRLSHFVRV